MIHRFEFRVRWGDCDPAGIAYYPRFLEYMNDAMQAMTERIGYPYGRMAEGGGIGFPMVSLSVEYRSPMKLGDRGVVESRVETVGRSSLVIVHRILAGEVLKVEARETRVYTAHREDGSLGSVAIPPDFRAALLGEN